MLLPFCAPNVILTAVHWCSCKYSNLYTSAALSLASRLREDVDICWLAYKLISRFMWVSALSPDLVLGGWPVKSRDRVREARCDNINVIDFYLIFRLLRLLLRGSFGCVFNMIRGDFILHQLSMKQVCWESL